MLWRQCIFLVHWQFQGKSFSVERVRLATEIDGWIGFSLSSFSSARRRMVRLIWAVSSLQWKHRWRYTLKHEQIGIC